METFPLYDAEEELLEAAVSSGQAHAAVYVPEEVTVVLGRGSRLAEIEESACISDGVPIKRRRGGGCAVVLDDGNIIVAMAQPVPGFGDNQRHFRRLTEWVVQGLEKLGIGGVSQQGISDLVLAARKVGGSCIYRGRGVLLYSTTLLVNPSMSAVSRYLAHPPREPDYRRGRSHGSFMGRLPWSGSAQALADQLRQSLGAPPSLACRTE